MFAHQSWAYSAHLLHREEAIVHVLSNLKTHPVTVRHKKNKEIERSKRRFHSVFTKSSPNSNLWIFSVISSTKQLTNLQDHLKLTYKTEESVFVWKLILPGGRGNNVFQVLELLADIRAGVTAPDSALKCGQNSWTRGLNAPECTSSGGTLLIVGLPTLSPLEMFIFQSRHTDWKPRKSRLCSKVVQSLSSTKCQS